MSLRDRLAIPPFLLIGAGAFAPIAQAGVYVVDQAGGGDFTAIQPAVDASIDGDTLLVRPGAYGSFTVDNKSLWIVADEPVGGVTVERIEVKNLETGKLFYMFGLQATATGSLGHTTSQPALQLTDNAGHVRAQQCTFTGASGAPNRRGGDGADIDSSFAVAFVQCEFTGGMGFVPCWGPCLSPFDSGGNGVTTLHSVTGFYECSLTGGSSIDGEPNQEFAGNGGHGVEVQSFGFFASGSLFQGGNGGDGTFQFLGWKPQGGNGGHGVFVETGNVRLLDNALFGGLPGQGWFVGTPGQPTAGPGIVDYWLYEKRLNFSSAHAISGQTLALTLFGVPGDKVYLSLAPTTAFQVVLPQLGIKFYPSAALSLKTPIAVIPASGTAVVHVPLKTLFPGEPLRQIFGQCVFRTVDGETILGSPLHVALQP